MSEIVIGVSLDRIDSKDVFSDVEREASAFSASIENKISKSIYRGISKSLEGIERQSVEIVSSFVDQNNKIISTLNTRAIKESAIAYLEIDQAFQSIEETSNKTLSGISIGAKEASKSVELIGNSLNNSNEKIKDLGVNSEKSLSSTSSNTLSSISDIISITTTLAASFKGVFVVLKQLEERFGLISIILNRLGKNAPLIFRAFDSFSKVSKAFSQGEATVKSFVGEIFLLLNAIGLLDSKILFLLNKIRTVGSAYEKNKEIVNTTATTLLLGFVTTLPKAQALLNITSQVRDTAGKIALNVKPTGLFSLTSAFAGISVALGLLGKALETSENTLAGVSSKFLLFGAIITGSIAAGLSVAIVKIAEFGQFVTRNLINFNIKAADSFVSLQKDVNVFSATLDGITRSVGENIGSLANWEEQIARVSETFNFLQSDVIKSAQEIALVGSKAGLSAEQLKELLFVSSEYAKVNQKDLFQTTVNVVSALNGQSQAAQALGIKLNQASVQQFAYTQGLTKSVETLSDNEKVQLRYNLLLKQYGAIAGVGVIAANQLGDQQNRLSVLTNRLNVLLGEGASIIERNNIVAFALNQILSRVNSAFVVTAGFASALGARLANLAFFILEFSFKIFGLVKILSILNIILASDLSASIFSRNLLTIGMSIDQLVSRLAGQNIAIRSVSDVLKFLGATIANQLDLNGKLLSSNSILQNSFKVLTAVIAQMRAAITATTIALAPFLIPLIKLGAIVAVVGGAVFGIFKAFKALEERTKVLSGVYSVLLNTLKESSSIFTPLVLFFSEIGNSIKDIAVKGFGFFTDKLAASIAFIIDILKLNPFDIFSSEAIASFNVLSLKLQMFRNQLQAVAFDISKIPIEAERAIAGNTNKSLINLDELAKKLEDIRVKFENFGLSKVEIIRKQEAQDLLTLEQSFANKLIAEEEYNLRRQQIVKDANQKIAALNDNLNKKSSEQANQLANIINNGLVESVSFGLERLGESLNRGASAFENFGANIMSILGDIAIQLGKALIAKGLAIDALKASLLTLTGGTAIAAGAGLIALGGFLKSFGGAGLSKVGSGGNDGASSASDILNTPDINNDLVQQDRQEREKKDPSIQLTINGNVFDSEETGTQIARILSESFNKKGVVLTDARFA